MSKFIDAISWITRGAIRGAPLLAVAVFSLTAPLAAQDFPTRTVRIIVPSSAGGSMDVTARLIGAKMAEKLGQSVVIENRPGGSMITGATAAAKSEPDGYTLLVAHEGTMAMNPFVFPNVPYDSSRFKPVGLISSIPMLLMVNSSVPAKSVTEFIELAKKNPGKFTHATGGTTTLMVFELFKSRANLDILSVPFRGTSQALTSTMSGDVDFLIADETGAAPGLDSGKLRMIGVTTLARLEKHPDVPTVSESGFPGFEHISWIGMFAPAGTPDAVVKKIEDVVKLAVIAPDVRTTLERLGMEMQNGTTDAMRERLAIDTEKWAKLAKERNIKLIP